MRKLAILGSTGSIGTQALDVAARHSDRFQVTALVAHSSSEKLFEQVRRFRPQIAALSVEPKEIPEDIREGCQWMFGENVLLDVVRACDADDVLVSVVGVVGLAAVMESLACGTPVAAFHTGGIPDMITDGENGILAPPYDAKALAEGIAWMMQCSPDKREQLRNIARHKSINEYALPNIARRYHDLYLTLKTDMQDSV